MTLGTPGTPGAPGAPRAGVARVLPGILALLGLLGLLGACGGSRTLEPFRADPGPYDRLNDEELEALRDAGALIAAGELENARRLLTSLSNESRGNLRIATFRQDVELMLLAAGSFVPGLVLGQQNLDPRTRLLRLYEERAGEDPTTADLVLLARLTTDEADARALLDRALAQDPACVWAHYGVAWLHFRARRFAEADRAVAVAIGLDPGHLRTRRLEAALLARSGEVALAIEAHERWLEAAREEPWVDPNRIADVRVDLATMHVLGDDPGAALEALEGIEIEGLPRPALAELVRATALERLDRLGESLEATRRAAELAPGGVLPLVQRAILLGERLNDPVGEHAAWSAVLDLLEERGAAATGAPEGGDPVAGEVAVLLVRLQARTRLARLEAEGIGVTEASAGADR